MNPKAMHSSSICMLIVTYYVLPLTRCTFSTCNNVSLLYPTSSFPPVSVAVAAAAAAAVIVLKDCADVVVCCFSVCILSGRIIESHHVLDQESILKSL